MNECREKKIWEITFDLRYSFEKIKLWIEERRITNSEDETRGTRQISYKGISRKQKLAGSFDFTFRYMDDVLSLNNSKVGDFFDRIYLIELRIKDTTDTARSASCLDLHIEIDSESR